MGSNQGKGAGTILLKWRFHVPKVCYVSLLHP
jgi:hypothetical protein